MKELSRNNRFSSIKTSRPRERGRKREREREMDYNSDLGEKKKL